MTTQLMAPRGQCYPGDVTDLSITVNGMKFENPFVLGSGPPGTNGKVIAQVVRPRLGRHGRARPSASTRARSSTPRRATRSCAAATSDEVIGFENIELICDRPFEDWLDELKQLKKNYPNKILIASIMEEYRKEAWQRDRRARSRRPASTPSS